MVAKDVLAAFLKSNLNTDISMGTNRAPPPIPIPALNRATTKPSDTNLRSNSFLTNVEGPQSFSNLRLCRRYLTSTFRECLYILGFELFKTYFLYTIKTFNSVCLGKESEYF
jgi:hypothetical protein